MNNQSRRLFIVVFCLASAAFLSSCLKDYNFKKMGGIEWTPTLAVPLVYSSLSINDILALDHSNGTIHIDGQNFISLVYQGNLFSLKASDFLLFPDQNNSINQGFSGAEITALQTIGTVTVPFTQTLTFLTSGNTRVDTIFLKGGKLDINVSSGFPDGGSISINIPSASKNGVSFSQNVPLVYGGSTPVNASVSVDLSGYKFNMTTGTPNYNQIPVNMSITLNNSGAALTGAENISVSSSLSSLQFGKMFGYIDQQFLSPYADTVALTIFNNTLGGGRFTLVDPKMTVTISNSYGVPIDVHFQKLAGWNFSRTPSLFDMNGPGIPNPLPIQVPTLAQIGQTLSSSFELNKTNTNNQIVDAINFTPPYMIYQMYSKSNPAGLPTPPNTNFVLDTSQFRVDLQIELPLYGTAYGFTIQDTVDNYTLEANDIVENFTLRSHIKNGYPCEVKVQVYFVDSLFNKVDSLMTSTDPSQQIILPAAEVGSDGRVTTPVEKTTDVTMDLARIKRLNTMKYLLVKADAQSTNSGKTNVKIYSDYRIDFEMGAKANMRINMSTKKN